MGDDETFPAAVLRQLAFLIEDHGFMTVREDKSQVRMESQTLGIDVIFDPRGEVDVSVSRLGHTDSFQTWVYTGIVGRASMERLLEIAGERMRAEGAVLRGDPDFFERLGIEKRREAEAWTAFYARRGPRPAAQEEVTIALIAAAGLAHKSSGQLRPSSACRQEHADLRTLKTVLPDALPDCE